MKQINVYSFGELSKEAKNTAIDAYRNAGADFETDYSCNEIVDSLKGLFDTCQGVSLRNWSLGNCNSHIEVVFDENVDDFTLSRAMAWIENNLYAHIRISYNDKEKRAEFRRYGSDYYPGKIKPCPFTGVCYDMDFLNDLAISITEGLTLKTTFEGLASVAQKLINQCTEYYTSDEYISETLEDGYNFLEDGRLI